MRGFTLIEMMITLVVVAILVAIAVPSYEEFTRRAKRSEARAALNDFAARQEQFFMDNKSYSNSLADLGGVTATENGYYNISIPLSTTISYTLRATAQGAQAEDSACATMDLSSVGNKTPGACW